MNATKTNGAHEYVSWHSRAALAHSCTVEWTKQKQIRKAIQHYSMRNEDNNKITTLHTIVIICIQVNREASNVRK